MDKDFLAWFNKYYRENWEVGPDTYSREEAEEIAFAAWQAAQPLRAVDQPSACPACGTLPEEMEHDPTCPLATAGN